MIPPVLLSDLALARQLLASNSAPLRERSMSAITHWCHAVDGYGHDRHDMFDELRGIARGVLLQGRDPGMQDGEVYGMDGDSNIVYAQRLFEGELMAETFVTRRGVSVEALTVAVDSPGIEYAYIETWEQGRLGRRGTLSARLGTFAAEIYEYQDSRCVGFEEYVIGPDEELQALRTWKVQWQDGEAVAVREQPATNDLDRVPAEQLALLVEEVRFSLLQDLRGALGNIMFDGPCIILARQQEDGGWTDQLLPAIAATPLEDRPNLDATHGWEPERWKWPDVTWSPSPATLDGLEQLDALRDPRDDETLPVVRAALRAAAREARPSIDDIPVVMSSIRRTPWAPSPTASPSETPRDWLSSVGSRSTSVHRRNPCRMPSATADARSPTPSLS